MILPLGHTELNCGLRERLLHPLGHTELVKTDGFTARSSLGQKHRQQAGFILGSELEDEKQTGLEQFLDGFMSVRSTKTDESY